MEANYFTVLFWVLPYINMNQLWVCLCLTMLNTLPTSLPTTSLVLSQSTSFECPASCIKLALVICFIYGHICVSMLSSHIIPPLPSPPTIQNSVLYICDCVFYRLFFFPVINFYSHSVVVRKQLDMISVFLNFLPVLDLWPRMWPILHNVPCALEKKMCSAAFGWNVYRYQLSLSGLRLVLPY